MWRGLSENVTNEFLLTSSTCLVHLIWIVLYIYDTCAWLVYIKRLCIYTHTYIYICKERERERERERIWSKERFMDQEGDTDQQIIISSETTHKEPQRKGSSAEDRTVEKDHSNNLVQNQKFPYCLSKTFLKW